MKKFLCVLFSIAIFIGVMPLQGFAAESKTVTIYGNKISVNAKQICFVGGSKKDGITPELYDSGFKKYYYIGDNTFDCKLIAEKLPKLQNLVVIESKVKNPSALKNLDDLVWLGFHNCKGTENLSFLKNLPQLKKFRYSSYSIDGSPERLKPLSYLKNVTELYIDADYDSMESLAPIESLKKLKKLQLSNVTSKGTAAVSALTDLEVLNIGANDRENTVDLSFLEKLSKLEELYITEVYDTKSKGISCVQKLPKLKGLGLESFEKADLSFVRNMKQLETLAVSYSNTSFAKNVGKLTDLKSLYIFKCDPYDIDLEFLPKLKNLEELFIFGHKFGELKGISKLKKLRSLTMYLCEYRDLSELKKCSSLKELTVYQSADFDISWIEGLPLESLIFSETYTENDEKITTLAKLKNLVLEYVIASDGLIGKIKNALPNCKITYRDY